MRTRRTTRRALVLVRHGIRVGRADFDRALAGVIGGLAVWDQPELTVSPPASRVYHGSRWDESTPCESELFGVGEGALN
jgi:hypothetical protein